MNKARIAYGGLHTECSTYNPILLQQDNFTMLRGEELDSHPYFAFLGEFDANFLPLLHGRAVPGGPISRAAYEEFKADFLARLRASLPLDGLYLAMHGAMFVEGMLDAEADWISAARAVVGPGCFVATSYDLHGNVSQPIIDALDIFSSYRTAPHIDVRRTMHRAVEILVDALKTGLRPHIIWAKIPVLLPGERTSTEDEPTKSLYAQLPVLDQLDGVLDAALMVGYVWADEPRATACAVVTGTDTAAMTHAAAEIAQSWWDARDHFAFGVPVGTIETCVSQAMAAKTSPAIIADSGDNPTGGGVGDRGDVLCELVRQDARGVIVAAITDRPACDAAFAAGIGATQNFRIGASLDPKGISVTLECDVIRLVDNGNANDREAVLRHRGITIVIAARRRPYHNIADFHRTGLTPEDARIIVVKSGYLSPELASLANPSFMALSDGVVNQDVANLPRARTSRPTFPFDTGFSWRPTPRGQTLRRN